MSTRKNKEKTKSKLITIILILLAFLYGSFFNEINTTFGLIDNETNKKINNTQPINKTEEELKVYFIDVGQADCILIENKDEYMLIDGGNNNDGPLLVKYFQELDINTFKYIIGTHPHEDHIGGLDDIIDNFNIETIYIPDAITTTLTFEDLLDSIENKNLTYTVPKIDSNFSLGDAKFQVIYTGTDTTDLNNTSIILKMTYYNISFLFTGDATDTTEKKILKKDIQSDVIKIGHHGSRYSSTDNFLKKVKPKYAIISVGKNNTYGHPSSTTINKLTNLNITTYRTDQDGTILVESNGHNLNFTKLKTNTNGG